MNPSTIITYVKFRGDQSFRKQPYNEADALAFSVISYINLSEVLVGCELLSEVAEKYKEQKCALDENYEPNEKEILFYAMASAKRYRKVKVANYVRKMDTDEDMTYYSVTYHLSRFKSIVAYPGTDKTLLSWKENFTFLYKDNAPGLENAKEYLLPVLKTKLRKVDVIGHSKGGALAVYAAMNADEKLQKNISAIYLFDAPGFIYDLKTEAGYRRIMGRINSYKPIDSVIGRMFVVPYPDQIIVKTDAERFFAHELLHWCIGPNGIERGKEHSEFSEIMSQQLNELVVNVEPEHREAVVNEMFDLFFNRDITELPQIHDMKVKDGVKVLWDLKGLSADTRLIVRKLFKVIRNL